MYLFQNRQYITLTLNEIFKSQITFFNSITTTLHGHLHLMPFPCTSSVWHISFLNMKRSWWSLNLTLFLIWRALQTGSVSFWFGISTCLPKEIRFHFNTCNNPQRHYGWCCVFFFFFNSGVCALWALHQTPVLLLIQAIIQSSSHVAAVQCIKLCR